MTSKPRYDLLDGLRGVAALMVIIYHTFECFPADTWIIGHGYLAVDFFFVLSGFVIGYAYDDRWKATRHQAFSNKDEGRVGGLTILQFFRRRLIRLHPMVVAGVIIGLISFLLTGGIGWDRTPASTSAIMLAVLCGLFLIPAAPGSTYDVRGFQEMYSLNGPHWSLFFEYIGNVMYALFLRRFSTKILASWTVLLGAVYVWFFTFDIVGYGNIGVGWTLDGQNFWGGLLRMSFAYSLGLLLSRLYTARNADQSEPASQAQNSQPSDWRKKHAFWICSFLIVAFLTVPCLGVDTAAWRNCLYEVLCVVLLFPLVVWLGASGYTKGKRSSAICHFLGEISYPLYAIHYPSMYAFYFYIGFPDTFRTPAQCWPIMLGLIVANILLAYVLLRFYDRPIRRWLSSRFIK